MKKISIMLLTLVAAMCFVACTDKPDDFGKSIAQKVCKKELTRLHQLEGTATVTTGYYECNDDKARFKLRQLAANELITYNCSIVKKMERVKKTRRVLVGYYSRYWTTENYWANEEVNTYFVTVALTKKGETLVYEEPEAEPDEDTKELKEDMEIDLSKFPESNVNAEEFPAQAKAQETAEAAEATDGETEEHNEAAEFQPDNQTAYDKAKAKENTEDILLKAYDLKIVKARNVLRTGDYTGQAEMVIEYKNVTPVGRIMRDVYDGMRFVSRTMNFIYYEDKGWVIAKPTD